MNASDGSGSDFDRAIANGVPASRVLLLMIAVGVATYLLFRQTLNYEFVSFDDPLYVPGNYHIQNGLTASGIEWAFTAFYASMWLPLTWISYMVDIEIWGREPWGFRLTNILLHSANASLILLLLVRATRRVLPSLIVSLLFACHPIHIESVVWITERKDVLAMFFGLLSFIAYGESTWRQGRSWKIATHVFFMLSLMAKPMLVTLPAVFMLWDMWPLKTLFGTSYGLREFGRNLLSKLPLFVLSAIACVLTYIAEDSGGAVAALSKVSLPDRLNNAVVAYCIYLRRWLVPNDLAVFYPHPGSSIPPIVTGVCAALLIAVLGLAVYLLPRKGFVFCGWCWFLGTLVPMIGLIQVGEYQMADRFAYFPFLGLNIVLVWTVFEYTSGASRGVLVTFLTCWMAMLGVQHRHQAQVWQNSETLFAHAIEVTGPNGLAENNLGLALEDRGDFRTAMHHFRRALEIEPDMGDALINLGNSYRSAGDYEAAFAYYNRCLQNEPRNIRAHHNVGLAWHEMGEFEKANESYEKVVSLVPESIITLTNLGALQIQMEQLDRAEETLTRTLQLSPLHVPARENLAVLFVMRARDAIESGSEDRARSLLQQSLELNDSNTEARELMSRL